MNRVELFFDEGPGIGLGHRRRTEALGAALERQGFEVEAGHIGELETESTAVAVVDTYSYTASKLRLPHRVVVAIDDLGRRFDVDLVVRPAASAAVEGCGSTRQLIGLDYALINIDGVGSSCSYDVLVTFGAADKDGFGAAVAEAVARRHPELSVAHAPGNWSKHANAHRVSVVEVHDGLVSYLRDAQLVVCAGGVTMLEALALGCPTIVKPTAANQSDAVAAVDAADMAEVLSEGAPVDTVADAVDALVANPRRCAELRSNAMTRLDGRGPDRVAEVILGLV